MSALAVILSGCVAIKSETASQRAPGAVTLTLEICVNDENGTRYQTCKPANRAATGALGYTAEGDNGSDYVTDPATTAFGQMLVGFRVPDGTGAPASFQDEKGRLTFNSSPGYAAALTAEYVPIAGFKWVGYLSSGFSFDGTTADNFTFKINPEFVLPQAPNGGPFPGPFRWRAVVGSRFIDNAGGLPADRPIECPLGNVGCFDSPPIGSATDPNPVRQNLPHLATPLTVSDYSVRPPDATSAAPGDTATLSTS